MSTAEEERIRNNVKRGYDWIAEHGAKYDILLDRVDVNALSINTMDHCVLAQGSDRNFEDILYTLYLANAHEKVSTWCEDHGFVGVGDGEYTEECWRRLLELDNTDRS